MNLAVAKGLFKTNDIIPIRTPSASESISFGIAVDPKFASATTKLYDALDNSGPAQIALSSADLKEQMTNAFTVGNAVKIASYNPSISKVSSIIFGDVDIGKPFIFPAKEERITVGPTLAHQFDVYEIQFAINPETDLRKTMEQLSFFVSLKTKGALALEIIPIRVGHEQTTKKEARSPEIEVQTPVGGGSVGSFYRQEITNTTLKATIVGTGEQAPNFGWAMSDEMMDMSTKRFVAIVGVPKGDKRINFEMVLRARPLTHWWELVQKNLASSEPLSFSAKLPR